MGDQLDRVRGAGLELPEVDALGQVAVDVFLDDELLQQQSGRVTERRCRVMRH